MATTSKRSSSTRVLNVASPFQRSSNSAITASDVSPFTSSPSSSSSSFASCHSSSPSAGFFTPRRSVSPSRVNLYAPPPPTRSVRFSIDRSVSPRRSIAAPPPPRSQVLHKRTCMCSPTTHPGSFRCALHKNSSTRRGSSDHSIPYSPNRLNMRRSAMTNSLVRIGTVEGDLMKRALAALIRPSSHQQRRRAGFQSQPSRLSVMSKAEDLL